MVLRRTSGSIRLESHIKVILIDILFVVAESVKYSRDTNFGSGYVESDLIEENFVVQVDFKDLSDQAHCFRRHINLLAPFISLFW